MMNKMLVALGSVLLLFGLAAGSNQSADAATASSLTNVLWESGDAFWNYDFLSTSVSSGNVDWPISVMFTQNATVDRAKSRMESWSNQFDGTSFQDMYLRMQDSTATGPSWDGDGGKKSPSCPAVGLSAPHYRVYGIGPNERLYNTVVGYWVPASTHRDYNECPPINKRHAQTEQTEDLLVNEVDENTSVSRDRFWLFNYEALRDEGNHRWENNGYASTVAIP